jgi:hypothetical protein
MYILYINIKAKKIYYILYIIFLKLLSAFGTWVVNRTAATLNQIAGNWRSRSPSTPQISLAGMFFPGYLSENFNLILFYKLNPLNNV